MWDKIDFNSALEDCKRVRDGIKSDDDFQNADSGLLMYYLNTIVQALEIATTVKRGHWETKGGVHCTRCGWRPTGRICDLFTAYCAGCGAKMDGDADADS